MAPALKNLLRRGGVNTRAAHNKASLDGSADILEAWGEGYTVGSLVILILIVICNYRRRILLHKLILLEARMVLAVFHGTFIFLDDPTYGWYLSSTALLLFISYQIHNVVSYFKIRPFLPRWGRWTFLITLLCVQPFWVVEAWDNFEYFNHGDNLNTHTRPWEALARDPWWIFTTCFLLYKIKTQYEFTVVTLLGTSMRLVVMILCMMLSIAFLLADITVTAASLMHTEGINPYWRLTLVFKCAADTIFLDDFKSVLDSIVTKRFHEFRFGGYSDPPPRRNAYVGFDSISVGPTSPVPKPAAIVEDARHLGTRSTSERRSVSTGASSNRETHDRWRDRFFGHGDSRSRAQHVELSRNESAFRSGDDHSGDGLPAKPLLAVPRVALSYER